MIESVVDLPVKNIINRGASNWRIAAKDAILAADTFYMIFSFFSKEVSLSIRYHMIRSILFAKSRQGTQRTTY